MLFGCARSWYRALLLFSVQVRMQDQAADFLQNGKRETEQKRKQARNHHVCKEENTVQDQAGNEQVTQGESIAAVPRSVGLSISWGRTGRAAGRRWLPASSSRDGTSSSACRPRRPCRPPRQVLWPVCPRCRRSRLPAAAGRRGRPAGCPAGSRRSGRTRGRPGSATTEKTPRKPWRSVLSTSSSSELMQ